MQEITTQALYKILVQDTANTACLVDVREPDEYEGGHVAQAKNIPMGEVGEFVEALVPHDVVYFICRSGGRSGMVARELEKRGVHGVNVDGGMLEWQAQGLPVVS